MCTFGKRVGARMPCGRHNACTPAHHLHAHGINGHCMPTTSAATPPTHTSLSVASHPCPARMCRLPARPGAKALALDVSFVCKHAPINLRPCPHAQAPRPPRRKAPGSRRAVCAQPDAARRRPADWVWRRRLPLRCVHTPTYAVLFTPLFLAKCCLRPPIQPSGFGSCSCCCKLPSLPYC